MAIRAGVVGAAGFAGIEVVRLLVGHPQFQLVAATSNELAGKRIDEVYPAFAGSCDLAFSRHDEAPLFDCDVVFLAVPHTAAMAQAPALVQAGVAVIDLSADFRLKDPTVYQQWYGVAHTATDLLSEAAFGLPELFHADLELLAAKREQGQGVLVGCAGCYPKATSLAAAPALQAGFVGKGLIIADAVSGVTGAGKKATERTHFCFANEDVEAYNVGKHRHTPEIEQILGIPQRLVFTPHLGPYNRGILSTVTMPLADVSVDAEGLQQCYEQFYANAALVNVLPAGKQPRTASVAGTCRAQVAAVLDARVGAIVATCAIDNIGKGAAGQAVQCANIVFGLPETAGLAAMALPV